MRRTPRRSSRLAAICAFVAAVGLVPAAAGAQSPILPNLVADPPSASSPPEIYDFGGGDQRLLLRFDGYVHNAGNGALEIDGSGPLSGTMTTVAQRAFTAGGTAVDVTRSPGPAMAFESADGHNHWHLRAAARYSLWNWGKTAEVAPAMKVGFCLVDSQRIDANGPGTPIYSIAQNDFCGRGDPSAASIREGISAGWRDVYDHTLYFQWIDISDVQPGAYWLRSEVDPENVITESDELNPPGWGGSPSLVNGYVATPVDAGAVAYGGTRTFDLTSKVYDDTWAATPGPRQLRIETAPAHGTLSVPVGQWFTGPSVTYHAASGYSGPDTFTFSARDGTSTYPRTPARATASLTVGAAPTPTVTISGAPSKMRTGATAQLTATVQNAPSTVAWYVNGKLGGDSTVGTITQSGFYRAPSRVPSGGYVTVKAVQPDSGASGSAKIQITSLLGFVAAAPSVTSTTPTGGARLSSLALAREGDVVVVGVTSRLRGTIVIGVRADGVRLRGCRIPTTPLQPVVCKARVAARVRARASHAEAATKVSAVARLVRHGRVVSARRQVRVVH